MILQSEYQPAWWLPGPHLQTLWSKFLHPYPRLPMRNETLELPDGDFLDLHWSPGEEGPLVILLHGLEGSLDSHYSRGMIQALHNAGIRSVMMHFRGCGGEINRLPRSYHMGETEDLAHLVSVIRKREKKTSLGAVGFSLGGNVLMSWLGKTNQENPLMGAVGVSVPFDIRSAADRISRGFSRVYQWQLLRELKAILLEKSKQVAMPIDMDRAMKAESFTEFDAAVTAPLHGFADLEHYYTSTSSRPLLKKITVPSLLIHARNDPFMNPDVIPLESDLSPAITLEVSEKGGHVGFVEGSSPFTPRYWLEERIPRFFLEIFSK